MAEAIHVLYVDDEPTLLEIARIYLGSAGGLEVTTATSALDVLGSGTLASYDAIISDYQMPDMDGIAFLKAVRARHGEIPFILFTGRGREEVVIEAINHGADFYLQKGGDPKSQFAELSHKIRQAVRRRRAETRLVESERRYRDVVETSTEFISRFRPDGTHVFVNDAYCRHFGKRRNEIVGHHFVPVIPEEDRERVRHHFASLTPDHPVADIEHRVIMPDGSIRWHWWNDHVIFNIAGQIVEYQSIGKDITDRKNVEEELRRSEDLYRTIFSTTGAATIIIAPDTTVLLANPCWEALTGIPRAEQEHRLSWTAFFKGDDAARMKKYHDDRRQDPSLAPMIYESRLIDAERNVHHCIVHVQMIPGTQNSVASLLDITERKAAEDALRRSEQDYRSIIENMQDAFYRTDPAGNLIMVSPSFARQFGYAEQEILGKNIRENFYIRPEERDELLRDLAKSGKVQGYRVTLKQKDGTPIIVSVTSQYYYDGDGKIAGIEGILHDITETVNTLAALTRSEARLRTFVEATRESVTLADENGRVIEWNPGAEAISGISREEAIGSYLWDLTFRLLPREQRTRERYAGIEQAIKKMLATGIPVFDTPRILESERPDGSRITTRQIIFPIRAGQGFHFGAVSQEVTDEIRSDEALLEGEAQFRELADLLPEMVFELDPGFNVTYANRNALTTMGFSAQDVLAGLNAIALVDPTHHAMAKTDMQNLLLGIPAEPREYIALRKDGSSLPVIVYPSVMYRNHKPAGIRCVFVDISKRRRAEETLRESEELFREVFNNANDAIVLTENLSDGPGRFLLVNDRMVQVTGYSRDELLLMSPRDFVPGELLERVLPETVTAIRRDGSVVFECAYRKRDGSTVPVEIGIHAFQYQEKDVSLAVIRDITERRLAEDTLQRANHKLGLLSGITRHDIGNQLVVLGGYLDLLHRRIPNPDSTTEDYLSHILAASRRIDNMIQFTREYEQIGVQRPTWQEVRALVDEAGKELIPSYIVLNNEVPAGTRVYADPLIARVFFNLIENALRHGGTVTAIRFAFETRNGSGVIVCSDDGSGIVTDEKERIFDRGFGRNTGFGLFISREVLGITDISIRECGEPGRGAWFEIVVPESALRSAGNLN